MMVRKERIRQPSTEYLVYYILQKVESNAMLEVAMVTRLFGQKICVLVVPLVLIFMLTHTHIVVYKRGEGYEPYRVLRS